MQPKSHQLALKTVPVELPIITETSMHVAAGTAATIATLDFSIRERVLVTEVAAVLADHFINRLTRSAAPPALGFVRRVNAHFSLVSHQ